MDQGLLEGAAYRELRIQRRIRILEHQLGTPAEPGHARSVRGVHRFSVEADGAGCSREHADEHTAQCGLATPARADESHPFVAVDGQTRVVDRTEIPEPFGRIDGLNQGRPRRGVLLKALDVSGVEQYLRVGMGWLFQHGVDLAGLNDASVLHHQHPVGDRVHDIEVVGDENDAYVPLVLDFLQQRQNGFLHRGIQSGRGFIGDEHFRIGGQG